MKPRPTLNSLCLFMLLGIFAQGFLAAQENASSGKTRPTVALVLAGGSAWGLSHIGVIQVLDEMEIPVDIVVGTSMGSIVGGLYAAGYTGDELYTIATETSWTELFKEGKHAIRETPNQFDQRSRYAFEASFDKKGLSLNAGIIHGHRILRFLDSLTLSIPADTSFDSLPRRFRAVATDVISGDPVILDNGHIGESMRASMSIPGIFTPYSIQGHITVDGGVVDNLAIRVARSMGADIIIAVDLYNGVNFNPDEYNRNPLAPLTRSLDIMMRNTVRAQLPEADLVIPVDVEGFLPTSFERGADFTALGRKHAEMLRPRLEEIKRLTGADTYPSKKELQPLCLQNARIVGGAERDKKIVQGFISEMGNRVPDREDWNRFFAKMDISGSAESLRIRHQNTENGSVCTFELTEAQPEKNTVRLNYRSEGTLSNAVYGNFDIGPSVVIRGLTSPHSELCVDTEILDAPGASIRFNQPIGSVLTFSPFASWLRDFTTRVGGTSITWQYQTVLRQAGFEFTLTPVSALALTTRFDVLAVTGDHVDEIPSPQEHWLYPRSTIGIEAVMLDSPIFPMQGIDWRIQCSAAIPATNLDQSFSVFESTGSTFLSLGTPFSVAFLWQAGTDFSLQGDSTHSAPIYFKPHFSSRRMFPGPLQVEEQIGSHILGLGLEIKHHVNWNSRGITVPAFLLAGVTAGSVVQNAQDIIEESGFRREALVLHANVTAGAGLRVNDAFGISVKGGLHYGDISALVPFITLELGAFGIR